MIIYILMPKRTIKKEDSEDELDDELENNNTEILEDEPEEEDEDEEEEDDEEIEKKEVNNDTEINGCAIEDAIDDDNEFFDNNEEVEITSEQGIEYLAKENRISVNRLTKYEMVRILGERTKQLTMGAKPLIKNYQHLSYDKVAEEEFIRNIIPYKIKRPLPNGKYEIWTLDELNKDHLLSQLSV
jgi:DNA-directed RNA polymerase subunit K/omega